MTERLVVFSFASTFVFTLLLGTTALAQQPLSPSSCPVVATLASSKVHTDNGDSIVIWFFNQGVKTMHGAQFRLNMLDTAGNRYPASQLYQVRGDTKPQNGDLVFFDTKSEEAFFGKKWGDIEGIEVYVDRIMFTDATVWTPRKGIVCKTAFLNEDYGKEVDRRSKAAEKEWDRKHPDDKSEVKK